MRRKKHFLTANTVPAEFENSISCFLQEFASRIPLEFPHDGHPFCHHHSLSLSLSFLRVYLPTSAFLSALPSSLCIPRGITRPNVHRVSFPPSTRKVDSHAGGRCCFLGGPSTAFRSARLGESNSFKSRCGPWNSANPLRIHRAPLANSSLAPNIFLSAHPFTAYRARVCLFGSPASLFFFILFRALPSDLSASF